MQVSSWLLAIAALLLLAGLRIVYLSRSILLRRRTRQEQFRQLQASHAHPSYSLNGWIGLKPKSSILVVLGSGGHTSEMMALLGSLDRSSISKSTYVIADTDSTSQKRFDAYETSLREKSASPTAACVPIYVTLPRSREVGQSYISSVGTTLYACYFAALIVFKTRPDLLIVNGPGTCVPLCWAAFAMRAFGFSRPPEIVFVESFARVRSLSLTGKLLYPIASRFVVQWPQLVAGWPAAEYIGRLC